MAFALFLVCCGGTVQDPPGNRLGDEQSPYLRQHADNPVAWMAWGEEAFRRAREEDKPIFLSIGYSTCHWCHVMEAESFMDDGIAAVLNENYVAIKVDREEYPDVDQVYMAYVQAASGHGGWPMSVWLTPDLRPFSGGTYFPRDDFEEVLRRIADAWRNERERIDEVAAGAVEAMRGWQGAGGVGALSVETLDRARERFARMYDADLGGFGGAPKFPRPSTLLFLLREHARTGDAAARDMVVRTLDAMADGGMHDHVGGGFHRYSVDGRWHVPHFEKMLYDQAQLAWAYLEAWQVTGDERHAAVVRDILDYVLRRLTHVDGGFHAAEDADTDHVEGATYVWTSDEIRGALGGDAAEFERRYGVRRGGNVDPAVDHRGELRGQNVLYLVEGEEAMPPALARLREIRDGRPQPHRDDKVVAAWNGLMISAFARAGFALEEPRYVDSASRAAEFVWARLWIDGELRRHWLDEPSEARGVAADYASLASGYLDLYEATFDDRWLGRAIELQRAMDDRFLDSDAGGYFESVEDPTIVVRMKERYDGAEPAANSMAALNLLRLERITGDRAWGTRAEATLSIFGGQDPVAIPFALAAAQFRLGGAAEIVFVGDVGPMLDVLRRRFVPNRVVLRPNAHAPWTEALVAEEGTAFVCRNFACELPARTAEEFAQRLGR